MSKDMIDLIDKVAELTPEKRREFLVFGQGFVAGVELNKAEETATAGTGETDCHGAAPLAMTGDDLSTASRSPSPEGEAEDGGAA